MTRIEVRGSRGLRNGVTAIAVALVVLAGVAVAVPAAEAAKRTAAIQSTLYFGLSTPGGDGVSEQQWAEFLTEVVTPRFPDGLTVFTAYGQGGPKPGKVMAEATKVLLVVHPDTAAASSKIDEIDAEFRRRFGQNAFRTEQPVTIVE